MDPVNGVDLKVIAETEQKVHVKETEAALRRYVKSLFVEAATARRDLATARAGVADKEAKLAGVEDRLNKVLAGDWSAVQLFAVNWDSGASK